MELSLSDKEKRLSGKPWHLLKWRAAAGKGKWRGGFMVILAQMETHSWLTTSNWEPTSRSTWKDCIRYWGFSISEKNVCTHPFDGNDPALSALWARGRMCSWGKQLPHSDAWICPRGGSILQTASVTTHDIYSCLAISRFLSQYNFWEMTNLIYIYSIYTYTYTYSDS